MNTREALKHYIETELAAHNKVDLGYGDDLLMSGLLNSLGVMRLVAFSEKHFSIKIPPQDITIDHFGTIETIATYIESRHQNAETND